MAVAGNLLGVWSVITLGTRDCARLRKHTSARTWGNDMHTTHGAARTRGPLVLALVTALLLPLLAATLTTGPAQATSTATASARTFETLRPGDRGWTVRILQSRLHQLGLHTEVITGRFDDETTEGVRTFQKRRKWKVTGVVDEAMWTKLLEVTTEPTHEALTNQFTPGEPLLARGAKGKKVRDLQARLKQLHRYRGKVTGQYARSTVKAVKTFQTKQRIPVTGFVDQRTLDRLLGKTRQPTKAELYNIVPKGPKLDPRCVTGRAMCIDKSSRSLRWVVDGVVQKAFDVRFGSAELPTREGEFSVFSKSRDHVSSLYNTPMPFAMFFSGGQAVHYSPDFAANGYNGASHGCVNVRDRAGIEWLFDEVAIGDRVVVYWSSKL